MPASIFAPSWKMNPPNSRKLLNPWALQLQTMVATYNIVWTYSYVISRIQICFRSRTRSLSGQPESIPLRDRGAYLRHPVPWSVYYSSTPGLLSRETQFRWQRMTLQGYGAVRKDAWPYASWETRKRMGVLFINCFWSLFARFIAWCFFLLPTV